MCTLVLEAATYAASVAVLDGSAVVAECDVAMRGAHEERLMPAVAESLAAAGLGPCDLDRIVCGAGPGSFTSLRIAASIAKGIAAGCGLPLLAVSSLLLAAASIARPGRYLVVLDAMRGDVYAAGYELAESGTVTELLQASLIRRADAADAAGSLHARLAGVDEEVRAAPRAASLARLRDVPWALRTVALRDWEPEYGRLAEAQVKWEAAHGRPLSA